MSDGTNIQWTDATWNIITGCSRVSPGCVNCYAEKLAATRLRHHPSRAGLTRIVNGHPAWTGEVRFNEQWLDQPLRWKRGRRIFVCAHGDLFHESVPDEWIDKVFAVMALAPQHTFQVLTKRAERMRRYLQFRGGIEGRIVHYALVDLLKKVDQPTGHVHVMDVGQNKVSAKLSAWPLPNVHLGVSVEDQENADARIPDLLATPAAVRWVSYEPALGPVDFNARVWLNEIPSTEIAGMTTRQPRLDWLVVGGESGRDARPFDIAWARSVVTQCKAASVPVFVKQLGAKPEQENEDGDMNLVALRDSHGGDWDEWPPDLCVREYPAGGR